MMKPHRKKKLLFILTLITGVSVSLCLALYALSQNINYYYTPSQIKAGKAPKQISIRVGGVVKEGSVYHGKNLLTQFVLIDHQQEIKVQYRGMLPDLFREGQGIVTQGRLLETNVLDASQVLAKHSEDYRGSQ